MAFPQYVPRTYAGGAPALQLAGNVLDNDLNLSVAGNFSGWPSGSAGVFSVSIDNTLPSLEKVLCSAFNATTGILQVWTDGVNTGRGYDGTTATGHVPQPSIPQIEPCWTAVEAQEANASVVALLGQAKTAPAGTLLTADGLGGVSYQSPGGGVAGLFPIGGILMWAANGSFPTGMLQCNGVAVSRTTYAALFAVIGTSWGVGDGSTTFNLPNLLGAFPFGANAVGTKGGSTSITVANMPSHTHSILDPEHTHTIPDGFVTGAVSSTLYLSTTAIANAVTETASTLGALTGITAQNTGGSTPYMPPFANVNFLIRAQ